SRLPGLHEDVPGHRVLRVDVALVVEAELDPVPAILDVLRLGQVVGPHSRMAAVAVFAARTTRRRTTGGEDANEAPPEAARARAPAATCRLTNHDLSSVLCHASNRHRVEPPRSMTAARVPIVGSTNSPRPWAWAAAKSHSSVQGRASRVCSLARYRLG